VHFTPSPVAGNCEYIIRWYRNNVWLINSYTSLSPTIYHHYVPSGQFEGYYYAVVQDDCCPYEAVSDVAIIDPDCIPVIAGPCYKCNNDHTPITLVGDMIIPPDTPCPYIGQCTYQWYDNSPGQPQRVIIPGATNLVLDAPDVGIYVLESNCNGLIQYADFTIERCDPCASGLRSTRIAMSHPKKMDCHFLSCMWLTYSTCWCSWRQKDRKSILKSSKAKHPTRNKTHYCLIRRRC